MLNVHVFVAVVVAVLVAHVGLVAAVYVLLTDDIEIVDDIVAVVDDIVADDGRHSKASLFMRSTSNTFYIYHYDLWTPDQASYEKYLQVYNQMLSTLAFNTQ